MKAFETSGIVSLHIGEIGLTEAQAEPRRASLEKVKDGVYRITGAVQFKAGEVIRLSSIPKPFAAHLKPVKSAVKE